jgi:hypothetical protein
MTGKMFRYSTALFGWPEPSSGIAVRDPKPEIGQDTVDHLTLMAFLHLVLRRQKNRGAISKSRPGNS